MPLIVVHCVKAPKAEREAARLLTTTTRGVYVGNITTRVAAHLWVNVREATPTDGAVTLIRPDTTVPQGFTIHCWPPAAVRHADINGLSLGITKP